ncbi:cation:proton antiporter [Methylomagnum ishizawai]|uniref:cation:proton antiporter n=1 Tax=Methylomagnum ishizawai TaxID=1760988 RepID=UPI001C321701|nr:cation:proton antiporter [Methylomagnum ishizawai]BBL77257.1 peptidase [Methylomagnum ishizawai]
MAGSSWEWIALSYAALLLVAVLLSGLAERSVLSTAVLFLAGGFALGEGGLGVIALRPDDPPVAVLADLALFSVLFSDGMRISFRDLATAWHLPGRALLLGMPLTMGITAVFAHALVGLGWVEAFLVGAVLGPTDPVFAVAIVGREEIPARLRHLLRVESGLNDGLALPIVLVILARLRSVDAGSGQLVAEILSGALLGVAVPWAAVGLERACLFRVSREYQPLFALAVGLLVLSLSRVLGVNEYLAAFAAGITLTSVGVAWRDGFLATGEQIAEVLKLLALMAFGALISPGFFRETAPASYLFACAALFVARPLALHIALLGSPLDGRERWVAAWFGPKGFASVVYGILILKAAIPGASHLFHLVALVIAGSMVAHSSTDVLIARWFHRSARRKDTG